MRSIRRRWLVEPGASFAGADGEVRHVIAIHKLGLIGSWQEVEWDSVPLTLDYWDFDLKDRDARPHGQMSMMGFQEWIVEQVGP